VVLLASAAVVAALDLFLVERKYGFLTGGFLAQTYLRSPAQRVAFALITLTIHAGLITPLTGVALILSRRLGFRGRSPFLVAFMAALLPFVVIDFVSFQIWAYLGGAFDFGVMFNLAGRRMSEIAAVALPLVVRPLIVTVVALAALITGAWWLRRVSGGGADPTVPSGRTVVRWSAVGLAVSCIVASAGSLSSDVVAYGLRLTPVSRLLISAIDVVTDVDRDGYGLLSRPRDTAPFDASIHPYAIDVPGNGIDEDGVAGDLPLAESHYSERPARTEPWVYRPPVLLILLESFRADVLGARFNGKPVTPVLDALGRDGLQVTDAWSHNGFTAQSRFHVLSGSLADLRGHTTLLDDFKSHGYDVGYFSAQDDSFGGLPLDFSRADVFFDARQEMGRRYSAYTTPGSLAIPWEVLREHLKRFLDARSTSAPLFLYVNLHDTHYPYTHPGIENILGVTPLPASQIAPDRREDMYATYLNTAANVDRAIGQLLLDVEQSVHQRPAVIVLSDHGESMFDEGFLGHGFALDDAQTRIPLVLSNLPARIALPFGQVDLRDTIADALSGAAGGPGMRPAIAPDRRGRVFQYIGTLDRPAQIGVLTSDGRIVYDFRSNAVQIAGKWTPVSRLDTTGQQQFRRLVFEWERMRLAHAASQSRGINP
jgi:hypothetical protein